MKALVEKRNDLIEEMEGLLAVAKGESRALASGEITRVGEIRSEIGNIDATLKIEDEQRGIVKMEEIKAVEVRTAEEVRAEEVLKEERQFVSLLRGESRAANDLTAGLNGVVIPKTIATKIIDKVFNLSPILSKATVYNVTGDLVIPSYDYTKHLPTGYFTELVAITNPQATTFGAVTLTNNIIVTLALISKSLINRGDVDVVPFIVNEIAKAIAFFLEKELVAGTGTVGRIKGLAQVAAPVLVATTTAGKFTPQELISLQLSVPQAFQSNCAWIMHPKTLGYIQGLTAGAGNNMLIMGNTLSESAPFTLLGKPVFVSDNMPQIGINSLELFYGDYSGLAVKMTRNVEVQVLIEKYADQYAIGVLGSIEIDSAIAEPQKIVALKGNVS